jgi:sugar phosphate permease
MILRHGWRSAFVVTGLAGAVWLALWLSIYKTPRPESASAQQATITPRVRRPVAKLFRTRVVWGFTVAKAFIDPVWYFYIFWFPEYLEEVRHFSLAQIGALAWIPFVIAGLGNLFGGVVGSLLLRTAYSLEWVKNKQRMAIWCAEVQVDQPFKASVSFTTPGRPQLHAAESLRRLLLGDRNVC